MKIVNKKFMVLIVIFLMLLVGCVMLFNPSTAIISLKSEHASFTKENGIITEVRFHVPDNFNVIELNLESEIGHDQNGNEEQIMIYRGNVKKSFFASKPQIPIDRSHVYKFIFTDKTINIVNGIITDSLHQ